MKRLTASLVLNLHYSISSNGFETLNHHLIRPRYQYLLSVFS